MYYLINPSTLRTLRDRKNWSQDELAKNAGIDRQTIVRKEQPNAARTRDFIVQKIANALGVSANDLTSELPDSNFQKDPQIFIDLDEAIKTKDHILSWNIIEYVTYKLACALHSSQMLLDPDWIEKCRKEPKAVPELAPRWPSYFKRPEDDDTNFSEFLRCWYEYFDDRPISSSYLLSDKLPLKIAKALRRLPVMENGRVNLFRLRAYLRLRDRSVADQLQLWRFPSLKQEAWVVLPCDGHWSLKAGQSESDTQVS